jgi:hypothetical protein
MSILLRFAVDPRVDRRALPVARNRELVSVAGRRMAAFIRFRDDLDSTALPLALCARMEWSGFCDAVPNPA